jgi:polyhydroxybutyrate depolymerase
MNRWLFGLVALAAIGCGDDSSAASGGGGSDAGGNGSGAGSSEGGGPSDGGSGAGVAIGSEGCGIALSETTGEWLAKTVDVGGTTREYFVYLPAGYDPARAYPVIYQFHGCSSSPDKENNNVPVQNESGADAIIVRGRAVGDCWENGADGPDVAFFDQLVSVTESSYCADEERRFAAGYSSGAFMTHLLACVRGSELRGVASIAGGQAGSGCTGAVAALLIHDSDDGTVNISASLGARDQHLAANTCEATTTAFDPAPCVSYDGCDAGLPVVWCQTSGQDHSRQDDLAAPAFWNFFSGL